MEVDKCSVDIPGIPQCAFMVETDFFKAPPGRDISPLNHGIDAMQVIDGECQSSEMCDRLGSHSLVPIVEVADDDPNFAASMGGINMFQRTVADERFLSIHRE